ncbi:MAG: META domain-containing protein [Sphingobacteriales bacterium]|nr:MAG: META domain-containing protein [Sphingobacteriales bacterium]
MYMKRFITPVKAAFLLAALSAGLYPGSIHAQSKKNKTSASTSRNSLDWTGAYSNGLIQLSLFDDNSYLYKNGNIYNSGKVTWGPGGNRITLAGTQEKYKVMEGKLKNEFNGNEFVKSGGSMEGVFTGNNTKINKRLLGGKWVLTELRGKAIVKSEQLQKEPFLAFKEEDGTFSGHSGCNGFGGSIKKMDDFRIEFGPAIQTMMACLGIMDIENQLGEALRTADNYTVNNGVLSLNKGKMAPLAKFKFVASE